MISTLYLVKGVKYKKQINLKKNNCFVGVQLDFYVWMKLQKRL